jgi:lipoprotein-anchoring transpeptidase ErfK/SrfK
MKLHTRASLAAVIATAALLLSGCAAPAPAAPPSTSITHAATTPTPTPTPVLSVGTAATAAGSSVDVYTAPDGDVVTTLSNPTEIGAPLTFLVADLGKTWTKVDLAQRPNGSTGWIKTASVNLSNLQYALRVSTTDNTLSLYKGTSLVKTVPAATGTGGTPTPHGTFYLVELLQPTNDGYGPYAFGLSAFSDVLSSFGGGPGQIGLHGTDDAASIGQSASHGCIRLSNDEITELATLLPLGTPITIS